MSVLVVDFGTSSCRAATVTTDGRVRSVSRVDHPVDVSAGTVDVEAAWHTVLRAIIAERGGNPEPVDAIGIASILAWVFLDHHDQPLLPALTYADSRGAEQSRGTGRPNHVPTDQDARDEDRWCTLSGRRARSDLAAWKIAWLRDELPDLFGRTSAVHGLKDEFVRRLTGVRVTDLAHADYTHCFSPAQRRFLPELCERIGVLPSLFAAVVPAQQVVGTLQKDVARSVGLPAGLPVVAGSSDGTAAMYGCGVLGGATVAVCGTTDVLMHHLAAYPPSLPHALTVNSAMEGAGFLAGGATGSSGGMLSLTASLAGLPLDECDAAVLDVPPGSAGLIALPSISGERAPYWDDTVPAGFSGLRNGQTRGHLVRAVMESCAYRWRRLTALLAESGAVEVHRIAVAGGGAASAVWNQIRCDVTQRPVVRRAERESTILGVAMFARAGLDSSTSLAALSREWVSDAELFQPRTEYATVYAEGFSRFERVLRALSESEGTERAGAG